MVSNAGPVAPRNAQDPNLVKAVDAAQLPHPAIQRAGLLHSVAQALAGNPTRTVIDPDGTHRTVPVQASSKSLMMAVALEALQGSLTGLAAGRGKGPGVAGVAAMQQAQQQKQQAQQLQEQQAQSQFDDRAKALAQQASAYAANLRTRALAQEVGMRDEASHKEWVAQHASTVAYLRNMAPESIIKDSAPESEITTPEFTRKALQNGWVAIPSGYEPRYDSHGNHFSQDGVAMHNNTFTVVDGRKIQIPSDVISKAQQWNLPGFTNRNGEPVRGLEDTELRIGTILDTSNKVAVLDQEQRDLDGYYGYLGSKGVKGADGKPVVAPDLKQLVRQTPSLTSYIVGPWANHFGETPSAAFKGMKDNAPAKGPLLNLYGGQQTLDKYDLLKDLEKKGAEKTLDANIDVQKERNLIPIHAANAKAEAQAKASVAAASAKNEDGSWNQNSIPVSLVEGNMDPSQLSKRGADYNSKLEQANQYSTQKFGKPFDIAKAQSDYSYAKNTQTQNTLKALDNIVQPNGAIDIAQTAAKGLPGLNSQTLNKVFNIGNAEFGDHRITDFHTAMLGLADNYSKVQGGGVSTDSNRQQSLDLLKDAYSKGQLAGALDIMRKDLSSVKSSKIGDNRYLQKQYGGGQNTNSAQAPPVSLLKQGVDTRFANGQVWTLQNGQPTQVK
jgi:hypothetical protein